MFGLTNVCTLTVLVVVGALVLGEQLHNEKQVNHNTNRVDDVDLDILNVEKSLDDVQNLLTQIEQDPEQRKQFVELGKHVSVIREQLRTIQEEYHLNKNADQFHNRLGEWGEQFRAIGDRLKRDLRTTN